MIWTSPSHECYLHRDDSFDCSWLNQHSADLFVAIAVKKVLNLADIYVYSTDNNCNLAVDSICPSDITNCMHISCDASKTGTSLLSVLFESIRNAVAHGTICNCNNTIIMLCQQKPKHDSCVKFFCHIDEDVSAFRHLREEMITATNTLEMKLVLFAYAVGGNVDSTSKSVYVSSNNNHVFFRDDFKLGTKKTEQLRELIHDYEEKKIDGRIYVVIKESINIYAAKNLCSTDGRIQIINQYQLNNLFSMNGIHMREEKTK